MPTLSVAARSLAMAVIGLAALPAIAQTPIVTPFDPNAGVRLPGMPRAGAPLPAPPPGPIQSRLATAAEREEPAAAASILVPVPAPAPATIATAPATFAPPPAVPPPSAATPPAAPTATAALAPEPASPPPARGAAIATIPFAVQSADISDAGRSELDRIAKVISDKRPRSIELHAFTVGADIENRKVALARALIVRAYLIDRGVKSRIEVGAFAGDGERLDILVPGT